MGGACSTYGRIQDFGGGNLKEEDHLGDSSVNGKTIIRWLFRKWGVGVWTALI